MSSRVIHTALLAVVLAASGCAFEAGSGPPTDEVDTRSSGLGTGSDEVNQPSSTDPDRETANPSGAEDPEQATQQSNDPGKPSPDPWRTPKASSTSDDLLPGWVDPRLKPTVR